jgi:hypothetical protein
MGADGVCGPIEEGGKARFGCDPTGDVCSPNGVCDGTGDCIYPPEGTPCDAVLGGTCVKGTCTGPCTSNLDCAPGLVCTPDGRCSAPVTEDGSAPACACGIGGRARGGAALAGALAALLMGVARRRRRQKE